MKPNDTCADVLNPDSLPSFLRVGGAFPVFLLGGGEGRRDLASVPLDCSPPSSVCRGAGRRRNVSSQSMDPSEIDGWCKNETMGSLLLLSPGLYRNSPSPVPQCILLLGFQEIYFCFDFSSNYYAFLIWKVVCSPTNMSLVICSWFSSNMDQPFQKCIIVCPGFLSLTRKFVLSLVSMYLLQAYIIICLVSYICLEIHLLEGSNLKNL